MRTLGLTKGVASKRIDINNAWIDYVNFVRKEGMSRAKALKEVKKKHRFQSEDATAKALLEQRAPLLKRIEKQFPEMYSEAKKRLKGLVLSRRG